MKIGILTLPLYTNIGGILQAYALSTVLQRKGHEVYILNRRRDDWRPKRSFKELAKQYIGSLFALKSSQNKQEVLDCNAFIKKYLTITPPLYSSCELSDYIQNLDLKMIVVGSDQVWRQWQSFHAYTSDFFLYFLKDNQNISKWAYGASFGFDECNIDHELNECIKGLAKFSSVSVREEIGVQICRDTFGVDAVHVLDPTMLLTCSDYIQLINDNIIKNNPGNILCYILDSSEAIQTVIENLNKNGNIAYSFIHYWFPKKEIPQWISAFRDASYVVTDSFHGCVFSILFNKPFVALGNNKRGQARFQSLLKLFGLEKRLVPLDSSVPLDSILKEKIDWDFVNQQIELWRNRSLAFIYNNL